ncbi:MAG: hypothetical protein QOH21_31 [Acidobacteriota bacterium]|nr:hypothetical protein [Acidobacteriota bacterium]
MAGRNLADRPWNVDISNVSGTVGDGPKTYGTFYGPEPAYDPTQSIRRSYLAVSPYQRG